MKTVSPARLIFWMKSRLLAGEPNMAVGDMDVSMGAKVYDGLLERGEEFARSRFQFTTAEFAKRFQLAPHEATLALNQLAESHFVRHIEEDVWIATQDTVVQTATSHQHGALTLNAVKRFVEYPGTRGLLKRIQAEPGVLRVVLGGNWLNKHARASIGAAIVIEGTEATGALVDALDALARRMDDAFRPENTLPPFILPVSESFPTLFNNAITISPITNWRTFKERTSGSSDRAVAEQLRQQWNSSLEMDLSDRSESDSLMVHAFAMEHFSCEGKVSHLPYGTEFKSKAC